MENWLNIIYNCLQLRIIKPLSKMISSISFLNCFKEMKEKRSNEELNEMVIKRKKISYMDLSVSFKEEIKVNDNYEEPKRTKSKIMFDINDRSLFIKNSKSKEELNEKVKFLEESLYIKCRYCGNEVSNSEIYCMFDNYYCSEQCRHNMLYKK